MTGAVELRETRTRRRFEQTGRISAQVVLQRPALAVPIPERPRAPRASPEGLLAERPLRAARERGAVEPTRAAGVAQLLEMKIGGSHARGIRLGRAGV